MKSGEKYELFDWNVDRGYPHLIRKVNMELAIPISSFTGVEVVIQEVALLPELQ